MKKKVLIFIISYNHEALLTRVIERIPKNLADHPDAEFEVLVIEDCSKDETFRVGYEFLKSYSTLKVLLLSNPHNLGFGGNQKLGYEYAIANGFDHVVLVHGDGQYAPELIPELVEPLLKVEAEAVFGSRMIHSLNALKGGMPKYKWIGNKILTRLENFIMGSSLSEWHSGFRLYSVKALSQIPFQYNSDYYDFDTDIIIQLLGAGCRIKELPIPTFYGDEVSNVDGLKYARKIILSCLQFRAQDLGLFYHPKFHLASRYSRWESGVEARGIGSAILTLLNGSTDPLLIVADGDKAVLAKEFASISTDIHLVAPGGLNAELLEQQSWAAIVFADCFESTPELTEKLLYLRSLGVLSGIRLFAIGANVGFLPVRLSLLLGSFNYGMRGILDFRHKRLYTFSSIERELEGAGFKLESSRGLSVPWRKVFTKAIVSTALARLNQGLCRISKSLFSYQFMIEFRAQPTSAQLLMAAKTEASLKQKEWEAAGRVSVDIVASI
jgi:glycosyltransferase involved in cell wall biosynthesis